MNEYYKYMQEDYRINKRVFSPHSFKFTCVLVLHVAIKNTCTEL